MRTPYAALAVAIAAGIALALVLTLGGGHKAAAPKAKAHPLPVAQPTYARSLQGVLDAARPKGERRIVVKDCRRGRTGNEHFCAWLGSDGKCRAGFISETPGEGTVPTTVGRAPLPPTHCTTARVLRWLGSRQRETS